MEDHGPEIILPPWAPTPVEQYFLEQRNWDPTSLVDAATQSFQLVRAFVQEDIVAFAYQITPTPEQIRTILGPWRPQKLRWIAVKHSRGGGEGERNFYFLRTYYDGGAADNAKPRIWLDLERPDDGLEIPCEHEWWLVLDDKEVFGVVEERDDGSVASWPGVYEVFPELAAPSLERQLVSEGFVSSIQRSIATTRERLLILDRKAFETGELGLIFRDEKGNVVRQGTIWPDELDEVTIYTERGGRRCLW
ncbi:hypothetical protein VTI74DRAFT_5236 [Chaetomium olivicolor]